MCGLSLFLSLSPLTLSGAACFLFPVTIEDHEALDIDENGVGMCICVGSLSLAYVYVSVCSYVFFFL